VATFLGATQYPVRWWGYPNVHSGRRLSPSVLLVVHITGNSNLPSALGEAQYSNRDGSGASFSFVTNRDGSILQCLEPVTQTPWTNGDINQPNTAIPTVKAMVGSPYNPNEFCLATCENVGYEPSGHPITAAQIATLGRLAKWLSALSGLPVNRNTVLGHRDINSVTRHGCPTAGDLDALIGKIIVAAVPTPLPLPDTATTEDSMTIVTLDKTGFPRVAIFAGGAVVGYGPDGQIVKASFAAGSTATCGGVASITQVPQKAPNGSGFRLITNGPLAGHYVLRSTCTLGPATTTADCTAAIAAATAPLQTQITALSSRLSTVKGKVASVAADISND
jgi:hypothetical protein